MKSFEDFKNALGAQESGNRYNIQNSLGYTGRYQFGIGRLRDLGYKGTLTEFKNSPETQEAYFLKHVADHAKYLYASLLPAKNKRGNSVTLSGLIAGAHLGGRGGVSSWINSGKDFADANGTKISNYVNKFSGYEIPGYNETGFDTPDAKKYISGPALDIAGLDMNAIWITILAAAGITILITALNSN